VAGEAAGGKMETLIFVTLILGFLALLLGSLTIMIAYQFTTGMLFLVIGFLVWKEDPLLGALALLIGFSYMGGLFLFLRAVRRIRPELLWKAALDLAFVVGYAVFLLAYCTVLAGLLAVSVRLLIAGIVLGAIGTAIMRACDSVSEQRQSTAVAG